MQDRQMFLIHQPDDDGEPSVYPQFNTIEKNLLIANCKKTNKILLVPRISVYKSCAIFFF